MSLVGAIVKVKPHGKGAEECRDHGWLWKITGIGFMFDFAAESISTGQDSRFNRNEFTIIVHPKKEK